MNLRELYVQLRTLIDWVVENGHESISDNYNFFDLVYYNFRDTVILELYKLAHKREERSLVDFLEKSKNNIKVLVKSFQVHNALGLNRIVDEGSYQKLIDHHLKQIEEKSDLINCLAAARDEYITHSDKKHFFNDLDEGRIYGPSIQDIEILIQLFDQIFHEHHLILFQEDLSLELITEDGVDSVLVSLRALNRLKESKKLNSSGIRLSEFFKNNYSDGEL